MDGHDRLLGAFLAGDLDPAQARQWDEHLLGCERCWSAAREDRAGRQAAGLLHRAAPPGLADRVAFAVEMAAAGHPGDRPGRARPGGWRAWRRLAGAAAVAAGLALTLLAVLLPGHPAGSVPAAVAAVARYAQAVPPPGREPPGGPGTPVQVGRPETLTAGSQRITVRVWKLGGTEAVVATSGQQFPMPSGAQDGTGGMAWQMRLGRLGLYCVNGPRSELVAAPVPDAELAALVASLPAS
jgi:hypothetical protein